MPRRRARPLDDVACVVFSRDRALQLDAFLESVRRHAPPLLESISVVFRATGPEFERAYGELSAGWRRIDWRAEDDFPADLAASIGERPFTVFHTDDDLYFRPVDRFYLDDDLACFSFRLGLNTTYCYPLDFDEHVRPEVQDDDWIAWRWREHGRGAFGYPLALNGHVFRTADVERWIAVSAFTNPNELEVALQSFLDEIPPLMASFRESRVVNVPANLVNEIYVNRNAGAHTIEELNDRFMQDERIDLDAMDFARVHAAHEELDYAFRPAR